MSKLMRKSFCLNHSEISEDKLEDFANPNTLMSADVPDLRLDDENPCHDDPVSIMASKACAEESWENTSVRLGLIDGHDSAVNVSRRQFNYESKQEMEMKFFCLAACGDLSGMKALVENGVDVNAKDYNGQTALHLASQRGHLTAVSYLIVHAANIDAKDDKGYSALSLAQISNHIDVQNVLRNAGAKESYEGSCKNDSKGSNLARFAILEAFPRPIATAILEGRKIECISKDRVSLFFSDIVGFTSMSNKLEPEKVSKFLTKFLRKIDKLAYRHGVQKIDVIGDAYVAATNFMEDQSADHAARLARFAVDVMKAARETSIDDDNPDLFGCVQLRVGLHCGPVVGSVVGWQNFKYTLMGDSVNTASRMESTGLAGRIQCSESIAELISEQAPEMILERRAGGADVKGKGRMPTFWLSSHRRGLQSFGSCPDVFCSNAEKSNSMRWISNRRYAETSAILPTETVVPPLPVTPDNRSVRQHMPIPSREQGLSRSTSWNGDRNRKFDGLLE